MLSSFFDSTACVKAIWGNPVKIRGRGKLHISLLPYSGKDPHITEIYNAVYVPSSPFNIIPPQMIISNLNNKDNVDVEYSKHDDTDYIISFKNKHPRLPYRFLAIPIGGNGLCHLRTKPGFASFCKRFSTL